VFSTYVGDIFPFAGCAGVDVREETVGIDFGGGIPWGGVGLIGLLGGG